MVRQSRMGSMRWVAGDGRPRETQPELLLDCLLSETGAELLFEGAPRPLDDVIEEIAAGASQPFEMPYELHVRTASVNTPLRSPNVIARLPGSDELLRDEYVVLTAHLDHLGIGDAVEGDTIHNGAYDNASGVGIMIEVARALTALTEAPLRSVLFLAVTGEEKGLLGSKYFVRHPTVPLETIVANVNLDMVLMLDPLTEVVAFGAEHSTLARSVERAAARMRLELVPDPIPEEVMFIRSDQFPFVQAGVPAVFLVSWFNPASSERSVAKFRQWMRDIYHSPADDMDQKMDFGAGADFARLNLLTTYFVANEPARPSWNPGDFFGERFGPATADSP